MCPSPTSVETPKITKSCGSLESVTTAVKTTVSNCVIWSTACDLGDGEIRAGGEVRVQCDLAAKLEWRNQANAGRGRGGCGAFVVETTPTNTRRSTQHRMLKYLTAFEWAEPTTTTGCYKKGPDLLLYC